MKKLFNWIKNAFKKSEYSIIFIAEFPETIKDKVIYIEGNSKIEDYWYVKLTCPCGCGDLIVLNLINDVSPFWKFKIDKDNKATFFPSIRKTSNCRSHFWIRKSNINWCYDN